jgi:glutathione peroxidase
VATHLELTREDWQWFIFAEPTRPFSVPISLMKKVFNPLHFLYFLVLSENGGIILPVRIDDSKKDKIMPKLILCLSVTVFLWGLCSCKPNVPDKTPSPPAAQSTFHSFTLNDIDGRPVSLSAYEGKVVLVVNVASKCGYTRQYAGLQQLYDKYKDKGFFVLGFPANNFGGQEPGTEAEIKTFCSTTFNVTFPLFSKISVRGDDIHPLYRYLTDPEANGVFGGPITWNFNKFIIGKDGKTIARFDSKIDPFDAQLVSVVEKAFEP